MSLILGILDSGVTGGGGAAGSYESIATVTVGSGGSSSITFSSIPSTYTHLQIRCIAKWTYSGTDQSNINISFNTSTIYGYHSLRGNGTAVAVGYGAGYAYLQTFMPSGRANTFGISIIDVLDYTSSIKNKTVRALGGYDANGTGFIGFGSGGSFNTAAITSVTLAPDSDAWGELSQFSLYGIKGS
jgi:hypothetical protein